MGRIWHLVLHIRKVDDGDFNLPETDGKIVSCYIWCVMECLVGLIHNMTSVVMFTNDNNEG